jgi:hypothetical protein
MFQGHLVVVGRCCTSDPWSGFYVSFRLHFAGKE